MAMIRLQCRYKVNTGDDIQDEFLQKIARENDPNYGYVFQTDTIHIEHIAMILLIRSNKKHSCIILSSGIKIYTTVSKEILEHIISQYMDVIDTEDFAHLN